VQHLSWRHDDDDADDADDVAGNGKIDFREFLLLVHNYERPLPEDVEIREMFNALDKDKNGYIDRDELKISFAGLGVPLTDDDVAEMMAEADVYADRIYFEGSSASVLQALRLREREFSRTFCLSFLFFLSSQFYSSLFLLVWAGDRDINPPEVMKYIFHRFLPLISFFSSPPFPLFSLILPHFFFPLYREAAPKVPSRSFSGLPTSGLPFSAPPAWGALDDRLDHYRLHFIYRV